MPVTTSDHSDRGAAARVESGSPMTIRPVEPRYTQTLEHVLTVDAAIVRGFARAAADHLANGPMTLADRDRLLGRGERLGLGRFDANLVLAVVERRHFSAKTVKPTVKPKSPIIDTTRLRPVAWPAAATAVGLQACIVAGAWWLMAL